MSVYILYFSFESSVVERLSKDKETELRSSGQAKDFGRCRWKIP